MSFSGWFTKNNRIGVEICEHELRYAVFKIEKKSWLLVKAGIISQIPSQLSSWQELGHVCQKFNLNISVGIRLSEVFIKLYTLSADCNKNEINTYLHQQAQALTGLQQTELALDFEMLRSVEPQKLLIRMVAARKQLICQWKNFCQLGKIKISNITVTVLAIRSLFKVARLKESCIMVLLEHTHLIYCVFQGKEIIFMKQIEYSLTTSLESTKTPVISNRVFIENIKTSFIQAQQFFLSQYQQKLPEMIYCCGSLAEAFDSTLAEELNIHIEPIDFDDNIHFHPDLLKNKLPALIGPISLAVS